MAVTRELLMAVRRRIAEAPLLSTAKLAAELNALEAEVVLCLPQSMRRRARAEDLGAIWAEACEWGYPACPEMCFAPEEVGSVWFVSKADSALGGPSVCIYNRQGEHLFSLSPQVDLCGNPLPEGLALFLSLRERFGHLPPPGKKHCKSCGKCICGGDGAHAGEAHA